VQSENTATKILGQNDLLYNLRSWGPPDTVWHLYDSYLCYSEKAKTQ